MNFCNAISEDFQKASNAALALPMANYLKNNFTFFGIKTEQRRTIFKTNYEKHKLDVKSNFREIAWELFQKQEREFHHCAIDLLMKEFKENIPVRFEKIMEKLYGFPVKVSQYRRLFLSYHDKKGMDKNKRILFSNFMNHSLNEQNKYIYDD